MATCCTSHRNSSAVNRKRLTFGHHVAADNTRRVFRDMVTRRDRNVKSVELTEPFEKAVHIARVLDILDAIKQRHRRPHRLATLLSYCVSRELVFFAQTYEIGLIIATIKDHLFGLAAQNPPTGDQCGQYWLVAAHLSEWALCGRLVASLGKDDGTRVEYMRKMVNRRKWTPAMRIKVERVSELFAWAVWEASTDNGDARHHSERSDYEGMGEDLAKLMLKYDCLSVRRSVIQANRVRHSRGAEASVRDQTLYDDPGFNCLPERKIEVKLGYCGITRSFK